MQPMQQIHEKRSNNNRNRQMDHNDMLHMQRTTKRHTMKTCPECKKE